MNSENIIVVGASAGGFEAMEAPFYPIDGLQNELPQVDGFAMLPPGPGLPGPREWGPPRDLRPLRDEGPPDEADDPPPDDEPEFDEGPPPEGFDE